MKKDFLYHLKAVILMGLVLSQTGCSENVEDFFSDSITDGEEVLFTTALPSASVTRSAQEYSQQMAAYKAVSEVYEFTIEMYSPGDKLEGTSIYRPVADDNKIGRLTVKTGATPLYWTSTTTPYAFKATAGSETLASDQTTREAWLLQDRLEGYGYIQKWDDDKNAPLDNLNELNYHMAREWRLLNEQTKLVDDEEDYKVIPLYLQHQRSLITVILKAGEGVSREALAFDVAKNDLSTEIYSYTTEQQTIDPLASEQLIHYDADKNGAAKDDVSTTRYDAIVSPYDYADGDKSTTQPIVRITLSGQHYSFYAGNDTHFDTNKESYKLEAGKHLTLTVILSRDSRKVLMTASIEDWTEEVTNTICDDYGNAGEPIKIKTRDELIDFLKDENRNKAGNVAMITNRIDLEAKSAKYTDNWDAYNDNDLNCTLSLSGYELLTDHRFVRTMGSAASLQNGTIQIGGTVDAAIARTNNGTIDDIRLTSKSGTDAHATVAGAVVANTGTISRCHSSLRIAGAANEEYVGGIAATSLSSASMSAAIDACTVTNGVKGGQLGGGIVGKASGYVINNTFEYGITLSQDETTHKNIVGVKDTNHSFEAENNAWPTKDDDLDLVNATVEEQRFDGIIDSGDELTASANNTYNAATKRYRLAQDITVSKTIEKELLYELEGNNKQISTSAMIFTGITGQVHDLTVYVTKTLQTNPTDDERKNATDGIAPLAFEVYGETAEIRNVKVKMADGMTIHASNPAGLVVWAWDGATISGCEARVSLFADVNTNLQQARKFAGGIVSTASWATITQCIIHSGSSFAGTDTQIIYYGGIVGGIEHKEGAGHETEVTITDCTSFLTAEEMPKEDRRGAIIGDAMLGAGTTIATKNCQGNWWSAECYGAGAKGVGNSDETVLGKRNAVTPTETSF